MIENRKCFSAVKEFFTNPISMLVLVLSIVVNLAIFIFLYYFIGSSGQSVILHHNAYFGVDLVGGRWQVYLVPLTGLVFIVINSILSIYFFCKKERIAAHILMLTAFMVQLGIVIATISTIMINY